VSDANLVLNETIRAPINANFPVKEIRFSVAYTVEIAANDVVYLVGYFPGLQEGNIIGTLSRYGYRNVANNIYTDSMQETLHYILREPTVLNGNYNIVVKTLNNNAIVAGGCIIKIELLG
jgi:hypothetical protein